MTLKTPFKLLLLVIVSVVILWAVIGGQNDNELSDKSFSSIDQDELVSAIQPLSDVNAAENSGVISGKFKQVNGQTDSQNTDLNELFNQATSVHDQSQAIELYSAIIEKYPSAIEPHLNLASLYANDGELEKARETLLNGFENNEKAHLLFNSLQDVHGALAAMAYSKALDTKSTVVKKVNLPIATTLVTTLDQQNQIADLKKQISSLGLIRPSRDQAAKHAEAITTLNAQLSLLKNELASIKESHTEVIVDLNAQLSETKQSLLRSQETERETLARVVRVEQQASLQLSQAKADAVALAQQQKETEVNALKEQLASMKVALLAANNAASEAARIAKIDPVATYVVTSNQTNEQFAIALVQSWARSWSAQNVDAYVSHYAANYTSSASLSRQQWLLQRQRRLTNKQFIKFNVSNFVVKDLDKQFSITFSQNYTSNTVDDTVTKRLIFSKNQGSWANAKIVNESIVSL